MPEKNLQPSRKPAAAQQTQGGKQQQPAHGHTGQKARAKARRIRRGIDDKIIQSTQIRSGLRSFDNNRRNAVVNAINMAVQEEKDMSAVAERVITADEFVSIPSKELNLNTRHSASFVWRFDTPELMKYAARNCRFMNGATYAILYYARYLLEDDMHQQLRQILRQELQTLKQYTEKRMDAMSKLYKEMTMALPTKQPGAVFQFGMFSNTYAPALPQVKFNPANEYVSSWLNRCFDLDFYTFLYHNLCYAGVYSEDDYQTEINNCLGALGKFSATCYTQQRAFHQAIQIRRPREYQQIAQKLKEEQDISYDDKGNIIVKGESSETVFKDQGRRGRNRGRFVSPSGNVVRAPEKDGSNAENAQPDPAADQLTTDVAGENKAEGASKEG